MQLKVCDAFYLPRPSDKVLRCAALWSGLQRLSTLMRLSHARSEAQWLSRLRPVPAKQAFLRDLPPLNSTADVLPIS